MNLLDLPIDILYHIFSFIPLKYELLNICQLFNDIFYERSKYIIYNKNIDINIFKKLKNLHYIFYYIPKEEENNSQLFSIIPSSNKLYKLVLLFNNTNITKNVLDFIKNINITDLTIVLYVDNINVVWNNISPELFGKSLKNIVKLRLELDRVVPVKYIDVFITEFSKHNHNLVEFITDNANLWKLITHFSSTLKSIELLLRTHNGYSYGAYKQNETPFFIAINNCIYLENVILSIPFTSITKLLLLTNLSNLKKININISRNIPPNDIVVCRYVEKIFIKDLKNLNHRINQLLHKIIWPQLLEFEFHSAYKSISQNFIISFLLKDCRSNLKHLEIPQYMVNN